ncbi:MAG: class IV adenylate cyclase [Methanomicrobiales archaeon]|nr:class IV adenylate cyclase [Methanomicrobiales archaeon]
MIEIEAKVRAPDPGAVRSRLFALGATHTGTETQRDVYYSPRDRDFARTDEALRIRYDGSKVTVTYKGPKSGASTYKARREINLGVDAGDACEELFSALGFTRSAEVCKERETYSIRGAVVSLDEVRGLGSFVEIEVCTGHDDGSAAALIDGLKNELGLTGPHIQESYLELLLA